MTSQYLPLRTTFAAGADLSAAQFSLLNLNSSGQVVVATDATKFIIGNLQNNPVSGAPCEVALPGCVIKAYAAANIAVNDKITATTGGRAVATTTSGDNYIGIALGAGVAGDLVPIFAWPGKV